MKRVVALLTMALVAVGMTVTSAMAIAGDGNSGNGSGNGSGGKKHHHHHHKCPTGTHKVITFKHGKRHKKCVADPVPPATPTPTGPTAPAAALTITPTTHDFGNSPHGSGSCSGCPTQDYTVTNAGGSTSGALTASFSEVEANSPSNNDAFTITQNGCTSVLAAGASCTLTVRFHPPNNNGSEHWESHMDVRGAPGGDAQADLSGTAT
jgi:hypothetical protein